MRSLVVLAFLLAPSTAGAQLYNPAVVTAAAPVDTSTLATKSELSAIAATIPQAATSVPPMETVAGAVGAPGTYRPALAVQPRITRAGTCTIAGGVGACTGTWSTAFPSGSGINVIFTPINAAATAPITCNLTAAPTITGYSAKCFAGQNPTLAAVTVLGISVAVGAQTITTSAAAADGTVIQVTGLPQTQ